MHRICNNNVEICYNDGGSIEGLAKYGVWHGIVKTVYPDGTIGITKYNFGQEGQSIILDKDLFNKFVEGVKDERYILNRMFDDDKLYQQIKNDPTDPSIEQALQEINSQQIKKEQSWKNDLNAKTIYFLKIDAKKYEKELVFYNEVFKRICNNPEKYSHYGTKEQILSSVEKRQQDMKSSQSLRLKEIEEREKQQRKQWEDDLVNDLKSIECDVILPFNVTKALRDECVLLDVMNYGNGECSMSVYHKIDHEGFSIQYTAKHLNKLRVGLAIRLPCDGDVKIDYKDGTSIKGETKFGAWHGIVKTVYPDGAVRITKYNFGEEVQKMILDPQTFGKLVKGVEREHYILNRIFDNNKSYQQIIINPADQIVQQRLQEINSHQIKKEQSWKNDLNAKTIYFLKIDAKKYEKELVFYNEVFKRICNNPSVYSNYGSKEYILQRVDNYQELIKSYYDVDLERLKNLEEQQLQKQQQQIYSKPLYQTQQSKEKSPNSFKEKEKKKQQQQQQEKGNVGSQN